MANCPYCGASLAPGPPWAPGKGDRLAYDPVKGRLWTVCSRCSRWTLTPLASRWETLEACEEAVRTTGRVRLSTPHLSLVRVGEGELVRVGTPPRREFVDWRYGSRLESVRPREGFWARVLAGLPAPPVGGYDPYRGLEGALRSEPWLASPFLDSASALTYLFSHVPMAPECPSCRAPVALEPWEFQNLRFRATSEGPVVLATCALCATDVTLPLGTVRPTLRMGLGTVTAREVIRQLSVSVASELEAVGGSGKFLQDLSRSDASLGELELPLRVGLIISLDEVAEMEALEAEWRRAEEMAAIMDGELTEVPGFESFRREILGPGE